MLWLAASNLSLNITDPWAERRATELVRQAIETPTNIEIDGQTVRSESQSRVVMAEAASVLRDLADWVAGPGHGETPTQDSFTFDKPVLQVMDRPDVWAVAGEFTRQDAAAGEPQPYFAIVAQVCESRVLANCWQLLELETGAEAVALNATSSESGALSGRALLEQLTGEGPVANDGDASTEDDAAQALASLTDGSGAPAETVSEGAAAPLPGGQATIGLIQIGLAELGYDVGTLDGVSGPRTVEAIKSYQRQHGLPADGVASSELLTRITVERNRGIAERRDDSEPWGENLPAIPGSDVATEDSRPEETGADGSTEIAAVGPAEQPSAGAPSAPESAPEPMERAKVSETAAAPTAEESAQSDDAVADGFSGWVNRITILLDNEEMDLDAAAERTAEAEAQAEQEAKIEAEAEAQARAQVSEVPEDGAVEQVAAAEASREPKPDPLLDRVEAALNRLSAVVGSPEEGDAESGGGTTEPQDYAVAEAEAVGPEAMDPEARGPEAPGVEAGETLSAETADATLSLSDTGSPMEQAQDQELEIATGARDQAAATAEDEDGDRLDRAGINLLQIGRDERVARYTDPASPTAAGQIAARQDTANPGADVNQEDQEAEAPASSGETAPAPTLEQAVAALETEPTEVTETTDSAEATEAEEGTDEAGSEGALLAEEAPPKVYDRELVLQVQTALNGLGYPAGTEDGWMGPRTERAIRAFQESHDEEPTGEPSEELLAMLALERTRQFVAQNENAQADTAAEGVATQSEATASGAGDSVESSAVSEAPDPDDTSTVAEAPTVAEALDRVKGEGGYVLEFDRYDSEARALAAAKQLRDEFAYLLGDLQPEVAGLDLGATGVVYQLRISAVPDRGAAEVICSQIQARSGSCLVVQDIGYAPLIGNYSQLAASGRDAAESLPEEQRDGVSFATAAVDMQKKGIPGRAIELYSLAIDSGDLSKESLAYVHNNRGAAYKSVGFLDLAIDDYGQAIDLKRDYARAYYNRGIAYYTNGSLPAAIADYTTALRLDPELTDAFLNRGHAFVRDGDYARAVADYTAVIGLAPNSHAAYFNRGRAYELGGSLGPALDDFKRAFALDRNNPAYQAKIREMLAKGDVALQQIQE